MQDFLTSTTSLIIANCISCLAAFFTIKSSFVRGQEKVYTYQFLQCFTLMIGSIFFYSFSGIVTFGISAARGLLISKDKFSFKMMILTNVLLVTIGLASNNRGLIGLIPLVATVIYTFGAYYFRADKYVKANIGLDLVLYTIYDFLILDIVSAIVDAISTLATAFYIWKNYMRKKI